MSMPILHEHYQQWTVTKQVVISTENKSVRERIIHNNVLANKTNTAKHASWNLKNNKDELYR